MQNQIIHTKAHQSCTTTQYVIVTMDIFQNTLFPSLKSEQPGTTYYLSPANIYGLVIPDASNNTCSVYTWTGFEVNKGMNNLDFFLLCWINDKGYYYKSHGKNHKMTEISILVEKCGVQNKNNVMIRFLNMIKEGGLFGTAPLHFNIKGHTNNDCELTFNILKVL